MNPISDLYVAFMERVMPFLKANWQLFIICVGALFLVGAIFRWKWVCDPQGINTMGFQAFVYRTFGEKGYRVLTALTGAAIMICGAVLWILM